MYFSDKLTLRAQSSTLDTIGNIIPADTDRTVWADIRSIGRNEFFQAQQTGLKPEIMAIVKINDYQGEALAVYDGTLYDVYRTYKSGLENIELYLRRKAGA